MSVPRPPVPPRPYEFGARNDSNAPPPIPPLPPNYRPDDEFDAQPHFSDPLVAPRPQKLQPDLSANMARTLDEQAYGMPARLTSPQPPFGNPYGPSPPGRPLTQQGYNANPGFLIPNRGPSPMPPPPPLPPNGGGTWGSPPPSLPTPYNANFSPRTDSLMQSMGSLSFGPRPNPPPQPRPYSAYGPGPAPRSPSPPRMPQNMAGPPSLTAPLPTVGSLQAALPAVQAPQQDPAGKVAWAKDVLGLVNRAQQAALGGTTNGGGSGTDPITGPARISDSNLARLADVAVPMILQIAGSVQSPPPPGQKIPPYVAEAVYLRAVIQSAGSFPQHVAQNPRLAFRDFESSARAGYHAAWFRLGRDYENFNDDVHARECFERGVKFNVESCIYRMGMAHLMGQLGVSVNQELAVSLLHRAATLASIDFPQPAYVYGLLLLGEFKHVTIPAALFAPQIPPTSTLQLEARKHLERAAYLNFAPAQYKLGHAYEFALPPFPYDALLSVQYYSLASQQGEVEADMALSKWFLCGADGAFEKDEALAYTFAEKAARKGLPSAEFAMGYYTEVGVGGPSDIEAAKRWYSKAAAHGNTDAQERLAALEHPSPQALSRKEHDTITEHKLVRKRTQAKQRSDAAGPAHGGPARLQRPDAHQLVNDIRQNQQAPGGQTSRRPSYGTGPPPAGAPAFPASPPAGAPTYPAYSNTFPVAQGPPQAHARPQRQGQLPQAQRYSLSDSGFIPPDAEAGHGRTQSPARPVGPGVGRGGGRASSNPVTPQTQSPSISSQTLPDGAATPPGGGGNGGGKGGVKYNTFEEMGFQSQKLQEKDCIIM